MGKLVIDGNSVYEIDEECICQKRLQEHPPRAGLAQAKEQAGRNAGRGRTQANRRNNN